MRILLHAPFVLHKNTGIARYLCGLVAALGQAGADTEIFVLWPHEVPWPFTAKHLHLVPLFGGPSRHPMGRILRESATIRTIFRQERCDVFHAPYGYLPLGAPEPSVLTVPDMRALRLPASFTRLRGAFLRKAMPASVRRAKITLAMSEFTRSEILALVPKSRPERLLVSYPGLDAFWQEPSTPDERRALRHRIGTDAPFALAVGTSEPHKNLATLSEAFAQYRERTRDRATELLLVGGSFSTAASGLRAEQEPFVRRPGVLTDTELRAAYAEAALYCFPSLYEGFGYPPLEALAQGCPVVAAGIPVLREVLGDAVRFGDPSVPSALATALAETLAAPLDPALGQERTQRYRWETHAAEVLAAYRAVLS